MLGDTEIDGVILGVMLGVLLGDTVIDGVILGVTLGVLLGLTHTTDDCNTPLTTG